MANDTNDGPFDADDSVELDSFYSLGGRLVPNVVTGALANIIIARAAEFSAADCLAEESAELDAYQTRRAQIVPCGVNVAMAAACIPTSPASPQAR